MGHTHRPDELSREIGDLIELLTTTRETLAEQLDCSSATLYSWSVGRRTPRPSGQNTLVSAARKRALEIVACADRIEDLAGDPAPAEHPRSMAERLREEHRALRKRLRQLRSDAQAARSRAHATRVRAV